MLFQFKAYSQTIIDAGSDQTVCQSYAELSGSEPPATASLALWTCENPAVTIEMPSNPHTRVSSLTPGINIFRWEFSIDGMVYKDEVAIFCNRTQVNAGMDITVCGSYAQLSAMTNGAGTANWEALGGSAIITTVNNPMTLVTNLSQGMNLFRWNVNLNGCISSDTVMVEANILSANAGADISTCGMTQLKALPGPSFSTGEWRVLSGDAMIDNKYLYNTHATFSQTGKTVLQWMLVQGACIATDVVEITNHLIVADAGPDLNICSDQIDLQAFVPGNIALDQSQWSVVAGSAVLLNPNNAATLVTNLSPGMNSFRWTVKKDMCVSSDAIVVTCDQLKAFAGPDIQICGDVAELQAPALPFGATGYWRIQEGSPSAVLDNPSSPNTFVRNLESGTTKVVWSVSKNGCIDEDELVIVNNIVNAQAGEDFTICGNTAYLSANIPKMGVGNWTRITGSSIIENPTQFNSKVIDLSPGIHIFRWNINNAACLSSDEIRITSMVGTIIPANAGVDQTLCTSNASLNANDPNPNSGSWSVVSGMGIFVNPLGFNTTVTSLAPGMNILRWSISNGNCSSSDDVIITSNQVYIDAGMDQTVCTGTMELKPFAQGVPIGATFLWTKLAGSGTITNPSAKNTSVTLGAGSNVFRLSVMNGGCTTSSDISLNYEKLNANAGADQTICSNVTTLSASPAGGYWSVLKGSGVFMDMNVSNTSVSALLPGENQFVWTVTGSNCMESDVVSIFSNYVGAAYAGDDIEVCEDSWQLGGNLPMYGMGQWSVITGGGMFANPTMASTNVNGLSAGTNVLRWTLTQNGCTTFDDVIITKLGQTANAGTDQTICSGVASLNAAAPTAGATGYWISSDNNVTITSPNNNNTTITNLPQGTIRLTWQVIHNSCFTSDEVMITNNMVAASAGNDFDACEAIVRLKAEKPEFGVGSWSKLSGGTATFSNSADPAPLATLTTQGVYTFRWTVIKNACMATDDILINYNNFTVNAGMNQTVCTQSATLNGNDPTVFSGSGHWTSLTPGVYFTNPGIYNTVANNLQPGNNQIIWNGIKGGCFKSDEVIITCNEANAYIDNTSMSFCGLSGKVSATANMTGTGLWTKISGLPTLVISEPGNFSTGISTSNYETGVLRWTVTNGACTSYDDITISFVNQASSAIDADVSTPGSSVHICNDFYFLSANVAGGTWSLLEGSGTFSNINAQSTTISFLGLGKNVVRYEKPGTGCVNYDDLILNNNAALPAFAGYDEEICGNQVTLRANSPLGYTGQWSVVAGGGTIVSNATAITSVVAMPSGLNTYRWQILNAGACTSFDDVQIISNKINASIVGNVLNTICDSTFVLKGTLGSGESGYWTMENGSGYIPSPDNIGACNVQNIMPGNNVFALNSMKGSCSARLLVTVISEKPDKPEIGESIVYACSSNYQLSANMPFAGLGVWEAQTSGLVFTNPSDPYTMVTNLQQGENNLRWKITRSGCVETASLKIINQSVSAKADQMNRTQITVCENNFTLNAENPAPGTGMWSSPSFAVIFSNVSANNSMAILTPGINVVYWTVANAMCMGQSELVIINNEAPLAQTAPDIAVCDNFAFLNANMPENGIGIWTSNTPGVVIESPADPRSMVSNLAHGANNFTWTITNEACVSLDHLVITNNSITVTTPDQEINLCRNEFDLSATSNLGAGSGTWSVLGAGVFDPNAPLTEVTGMLPGANTFSFGMNHGGCAANGEIIINNNTAISSFTVEDLGSNAMEFTNTTQGRYGKWVWEFGDGAIDSTNQNPIHNYSKEGFYNVCLKVFSDQTKCFDLHCEKVAVGGMPCLANFDFTVNMADTSVSLSSTSLNASAIYWNFGDGHFEMNTSSTVHHFDHPGVFPVRLSIQDAGNTCYDQLEKMIEVRSFENQADFSFFTESDSVFFFDNTAGDPTLWYWTFGDGEFSTEMDPSHKYQTAGKYEVCLETADSVSNVESRNCKWVQVGMDCYVNADFSYFVDPTSSAVTFMDRSSGANLKFFWQLGDGGSSTLPQFKHNYASQGEYWVKMTAFDPAKKCANHIEKAVQVGALDCRADFDYSVDPQTNKVSFYNKSLGQADKFFWAFDNYEFSFEENPELSLTEGLHFVTYTVSNSSGTCIDWVAKPVQVGNVDCNADFEVFVDSASNTAHFYNQNMGSTSYYNWVFGDGSFGAGANPSHKFTKPGYYVVNMSMYDGSNSCMDNVQKLVLVGKQDIDCEADFTWEPLANNKIDFYDVSQGNIQKRIWNFGDGSTVQNVSNYSKTYLNPGFYNVCLTAVNSNQIPNTSCKTIKAGDDQNSLMAYFIYVVDTVTKNVKFTNLSEGNANQYEWDFGDGAKSNDQNPQHTYSSNNYFLATLMIKNQDDEASQFVQMININLNAGKLKAGFNYMQGDTSSNKASGYPVDFIGGAFGDPAKSTWDFGDGSIDTTTTTPTHYYEYAGDYYACYIIEDPVTGDQDTSCQTVTAIPTIIADVSPVKFDLNIYPMPASSMLTVDFSLDEPNQVDMELFDIMGGLVKNAYKAKLTKGKHSVQIPVSALPNGIYILRYNSKNQTINRKIEISH